MDKINFTINGERYSLSGSEVRSTTMLSTYIRDYLGLHGTKTMCKEAGCGACIVSVCQIHPETKERHEFAVNSCIVHVLSCHEWDITTIEGVGNRKDGYHAVQRRLASFNGTQCGYCSPGMVMNMYSLYESADKVLTTQTVEDSFGSNMCRCTGYRPILDAFKSLANDSDPDLLNKIQDLEDLDTIKCRKKCDRKCSSSDDEWCLVESPERKLISLNVQGSRWYKAFTIKDVFQILTREGTRDYRLVAGNTGQGVYPIKTQPKYFVDISSIADLKESLTDENLVIGAGTSLTELIKLFHKWANKNEDFQYLVEFAKHLDLVAHVPVRNIGTIGGNLALKNAHHDFPSDVFLLFLTVGATITLVNKNQNRRDLRMLEFLMTDLKENLILNVQLPPLASNNHIRTYKIMPRSQNAHAIVNAGFLFKLDPQQKVKSASLVFGNIGPSFNRAKETENLLNGLELFNNDTLLKGLRALNKEINPVDLPPEPSPLCRKKIALGLFYKAILSLAPSVNTRYKSGGTILHREVSQGTQIFDTDKSLWPLNKPVPKLEALTQCSGEAEYVCDVYTDPRSVHVAFVLSSISRGEIKSIDPKEALKLPGVLAFFSAKDIPGKNSFVPLDVPWSISSEEILASKTVSFYGQPIGLIAAVTQDLAVTAAGLVKVEYKKFEGKLIWDVRDALTAPDKDKRIREEVMIQPTNKGTDIKHVIKGSYVLPMQYHYTMETQSCNVSVTSEGLSVRSATQWMDIVQVAIAQMLNIDENSINVIVPRVGGGYGAKASRAGQIACACALVAHKLNRTATLVMPLTDNMAAIGKRTGCTFDYEVGTDDAGVVQYLNCTYYSDCGIAYNDTPGADIAGALKNLYDSSTWFIQGYSVLTDKHSNTWCRAPGLMLTAGTGFYNVTGQRGRALKALSQQLTASDMVVNNHYGSSRPVSFRTTTEAIAVIEHIMERIAFATNKDPMDVRQVNIARRHEDFKNLIDTFKYDIQYEERRASVEKYNEENAWKKKGLKMTLISFPIAYSWNYPVTVTVYHSDATVAISHGGIEMGQGLNTKLAQVCAYTLNIPLDKVAVIGSNSFVSPNAMASNGSITSDSLAYATVKSCEELLKRLEEVRKGIETLTWAEAVKEAFNKGINLQASYMMSPHDGLVDYDVYGICAAEVELDILTGTHIIHRVDLLEDTGVSLSPMIDVGQIEGAFVMGLGLWTSEKLVYDANGQLLTNRTWNYKVPGAKDIPVDFRVSFRRNAPNPAGVLRSKATGEPALTLAVVVTHALHEAILEGRKEFGYKDTNWLHIDNPYGVENIIKAISANTDYFKLK